jgi:hypothetical protein
MAESGQSAQSAVLDFRGDNTEPLGAFIWWLPFACFSNLLGTMIALVIKMEVF